MQKEYKEEMVRDHYLGIICLHIGMDPELILEYRGRKKELLEPKQVLQYALYEIAKLSYQKIADLTYKKKHCTIISNRKTVQNLLDTDKEFRKKYIEPLRVIKRRSENRCLLVGDIFNIKKERAEELREIERMLIEKGKYPVLMYSQEGEDFTKTFKSQFNMLLESASIYVLPDYKQSHDASLLHQIALRLGMEIIYHNG